MRKLFAIGLVLGLASTFSASGVLADKKEELTALEQAVHTETPYLLKVEDVDNIKPIYRELHDAHVSFTKKNPLFLQEEAVHKWFEYTQDGLLAISNGFGVGYFCSKDCNVEKKGVFVSEALRFKDKKDIQRYVDLGRRLEQHGRFKQRCAVILLKENVATGINMFYREDGTTEFWDYVDKIKSFGFKENFRAKSCKERK